MNVSIQGGMREVIRKCSPIEFVSVGRRFSNTASSENVGLLTDIAGIPCTIHCDEMAYVISDELSATNVSHTSMHASTPAEELHRCGELPIRCQG